VASKADAVQARNRRLNTSALQERPTGEVNHGAEQGSNFFALNVIWGTVIGTDCELKPVLQSSKHRISGQVAGVVLVTIGGLFMFASLQRQLIYYPEVATEAALLDTANRMGMRDWRNGSGQLIGWHTAPTGSSARRVVVFHGNAGHALYRQYFAAGFLAQDADWQVYLFEYPGYGARPGSPSESDIKAAATDALEDMLADDPRPLYLVGESLGSGVAAYLAENFQAQVGGMLLVTPFTSLPDVASQHYGLLPVRALLSERYDSLQALGHYHGPVGFLIAANDEIVPAALGRKLYDSYRGPKWLHEQSGAGHNTLDFDPHAAWWRELTTFWQSG
jgi:pimeloyl-ACP methyl ester carboxylesterase